MAAFIDFSYKIFKVFGCNENLPQGKARRLSCKASGFFAAAERGCPGQAWREWIVSM